MKKVIVPQSEDKGKRLDIYLSEKLDLSRSQIKKLIEKDKVLCNGQVLKKSGEEIKESWAIEVFLEEELPIKAFPQNIPLDIVYEDEDFAVVNKPRGMVTHICQASPKDTLVNAAMYHIKNLSDINGELRYGIVHRLDKSTSGLILIAKNNDSHISLANQIANRTAMRYYLGVVEGNLKDDEGEIEEPIARHAVDRKKMAVREGGRYAKTYYRVLERFMDYTLVEFRLHTGRTHQIRVHMKHIQHPIVGDAKYGTKKRFAHGQLLHAHKLIIKHPGTQEEMLFTALLPDYFEKFLNKLRNG